MNTCKSYFYDITKCRNNTQVDGTVGTCIEAGFFVDIGPLQAFVDSGRIPPEVKFDAHSTPPMWTDGGDQIIEKGGHVRLKFMGLRAETGKMFAVGDINFDYLGCVEDQMDSQQANELTVNEIAPCLLDLSLQRWFYFISEAMRIHKPLRVLLGLIAAHQPRRPANRDDHYPCLRLKTYVHLHLRTHGYVLVEMTANSGGRRIGRGPVKCEHESAQIYQYH